MLELITARARVLSSRTRLAILQHIADLPAHPTEIAQTLGLAMSSISYHLSRLERAGLVDHVQLGRYRQYYTTGLRFGIATEGEPPAGAL